MGVEGRKINHPSSFSATLLCLFVKCFSLLSEHDLLLCMLFVEAGEHRWGWRRDQGWWQTGNWVVRWICWEAEAVSLAAHLPFPKTALFGWQALPSMRIFKATSPHRLAWGRRRASGTLQDGRLGCWTFHCDTLGVGKGDDPFCPTSTQTNIPQMEKLDSGLTNPGW